MSKFSSFFLLLLICFQTQGQTNIFLQPSEINSGYSTDDDSIYVTVEPGQSSNHKLLVFLPGTGAKTKHYLLFPQLAASLGYHCINLPYPNGFPTLASICAGNPNAMCYENYRQETCYGTDASSDIDVDSLNCIYTRLVTTLTYLAQNYPSNGWDEFLNTDSPVWSKIVMAGHSQGSGHALYFAKSQQIDRLIMFAGADDYSNYYSSAASWTAQMSGTSPDNYYSFLHLEDDVWDYSKQYAVAQSCGMAASGDDSTTVDGNAYIPSHCLYTDYPPKYASTYSAKHDGMIVDFYTPTDLGGTPLYEGVWTYLLTNTQPLSLEQQNISLIVHPNPANDVLLLPEEISPEKTIVVDLYGRIIHCPASGNQIDVHLLDPGKYFLLYEGRSVGFVVAR